MSRHTPLNFVKAVNLRKAISSGCVTTLLALFTLLISGCSELQRPTAESFYAVTMPPPRQEFRWSNGKLPKTLDPARAAAAPETDIVRAAYEGLTDLDSRTLKEVPAAAEKWESTPDHRTWTFKIRKDARWSNGERLTAQDFVRSWKRLVDLGEKAANGHLFQNIVGMRAPHSETVTPPGEPADVLSSTRTEGEQQNGLPTIDLGDVPEAQVGPPPGSKPENRSPVAGGAPLPRAGVVAVDELTLRVSLVLPDKDLPKLVANPIFRPVFGDGSNFDQQRLDPATVTNGAFRIDKIGDDGITLERSDKYWNKRSIALERVTFVKADTAEAALEAYRRGDVDVVTNAAFEPLALKLLSPFEDFRRTAHSALNFYEFNTQKAPFNDRRVREALAIAIDREKLSVGDLEGTTQPAYSLFALSEHKSEALALNAEKAAQLLEKAGYPGGRGMQPIRLVINRNDTQHRVARSIARMWKQNLGVETTIIVKEASEIEAVRRSGDFDILRRGIVLPANDELVNLAAILGSAERPVKDPADVVLAPNDDRRSGPSDESATVESAVPDDEALTLETASSVTLTEADAIYDLTVIPLYFPTSYWLVKPYVQGFEMNGLDAPSAREVSIDSSWQLKPAKP